MAVVGSAEIVVTALTKGFKQQIQQAFREARPEAATEGERYGKAFGDKFRIQLKASIREAFRENRDWMKEEGKRQGALFGDNFSKSFQASFKPDIGNLLDGSIADVEALGERVGSRFGNAVRESTGLGELAGEIALAEGAARAGPAPDRGQAAENRRRRAEEAAALAKVDAERLQETKQFYEELQALARELEEALFYRKQRHDKDLEGLDDARLDALAANLDRMDAAQRDQLSEHLARSAKAADAEESIMDSLANYSAAKRDEVQADLDRTNAMLEQTAESIRLAEITRGGPRAAKRDAEAAQAEFEKIRSLANEARLQADKDERDRVDAADQYLLALERVKDREIDLERARRQKVSTVRAKAAIEDARQEADVQRRVLRGREKTAEESARIADAEAERVSKAYQRMQEAQERTGASLNALTIGVAEKSYESLKRAHREAIDDLNAADADRVEKVREYTEAEIELADLKSRTITEKGQRRVEAQIEYDRKLADVIDKRAKAQIASDLADRKRVIVADLELDIDTEKARIDLYRAGQRAGRSFADAISPEFRNAALRARKAFTIAFGIGATLAPAIAIVVGAVGSLVAALGSLISVASQASTTIAVLPGLLGALAQAAITAVIAFRGVGEAISAGFEAQEESAAGSTGRTLSNARAIANARKALARAYEDNARRMRDANYSVADAEQNLVEAQQEAQRAQAGLNAARERAIERLEDLEFALEGAVLSEERAVLRLQRATQQLAEVQANPASTAQDLQEASLNYREAELAVRQAQDALEDLEEEHAEAAAAGVEGSAEVIEAQNEIIEANNRVVEAEEAVRRAEEDRADVAIQNARAIQDAQEALVYAMQQQAQASSSAASAANKYQDALEDLSPEARAFVEYVVSLKDEFKKLRDAAGSQLFGPLKDQLELIVERTFPALEYILGITGGALAEFTGAITEVITNTGFIERMTTAAEDNTTTISRFGDIIASVFDGLSGFLVAAGPLIDQFTRFLSDKAQDFQRFATSGAGIRKMAEYFEKAGDTAAKFGELIGNLTRGFINLGSAAEPSGQKILDKFIEVSERFENLTDSMEGRNHFEEYFNTAADNALEVSALLWDIVKLIGRLGAEQGVGDFAATLRRDWIPVLESISDKLIGSGGALADLIVKFTEFIDIVTDTLSLELFMQTLGTVFDLINDILGSPFIQPIVYFIGAIAAVGHALSLSFMALSFAGKVIAGSFFSIKAFAVSVAAFGSAVGGFTAKMATGIATVYAYNAAVLGTGGVTAVAATGVVAMKAAVLKLGAAMKKNALFLAATVVIAGLAAAYNRLKENGERVEEQQNAINDSLDETTGAITSSTLPTYLEQIGAEAEKAMDRAGLSLEEYGAIVAGGEAEIAAFGERLTEAGIEGTSYSEFIKQAERHQKEFQDRVKDGQKVIEEKLKTDKLAKVLADKNAAATARRRVEQASLNEILDEAQKLQDDLNKSVEDAIDNASILDDAGFDQERTAIRVAEGYAELGRELVDGSDAIQNYEGDLDALTDTQLKNIVASDEGFKTLDIQTEAGRTARTAIMDLVAAADEKYLADLRMAQQSENVAAATQTARDENVQFMDQLRSTALEMGVTEGEYDALISKITQEVDEQEIRFKIVWEESRIAALVEALPVEVQGQIGFILEQTGDHSPQGVLRAVGYLLKDNPELTGVIDVKLRESAVDATIQEMIGLRTNPETGELWSVDVLTEVDRAKYDDAQERLDALMYSFDQPGMDRLATFMANTIDSQLKTKRDELDDLMTDENGNPREVPFMTEDEVRNRNTLLRDIATLEATRDLWFNAKLKGDAALPVPTETNRLDQWPYKNIPRAEGGPIEGPGGPTDDKAGLFSLSNGEFVLSAKAVRTMGGFGPVGMLHQQLKRGIKPPHLSSGGTVSATRGGTLALLAEGGSSERVTPLDAQGLSAGDRAILEELRRLREQQGGASVAIGTIVTPRPQESAAAIVDAMRAESYRMGRYR